MDETVHNKSFNHADRRKAGPREGVEHSLAPHLSEDARRRALVVHALATRYLCWVVGALLILQGGEEACSGGCLGMSTWCLVRVGRWVGGVLAGESRPRQPSW